VTETLHEMLMRHEGLRLDLYTDTTGHATIGVGRNLTDNGISHDEAMFMFENDITTAENEVKRALSSAFNDLTINRQNALIDMMFNLGPYGFGQFEKMIENINNKDYAGAAREMLDSHWATVVGNRANDLAELMEEG